MLDDVEFNKTYHICLFLDGYKTKFTDHKAKCKDTTRSGNRIKKLNGIAETWQCKNECDKENKCKFFWHNSNKACYLFRWCKDPWGQARPTFKGSLFKKDEGMLFPFIYILQ